MLSNILVDILAVIAEKCVSSSTEGLKQEKNLKTETSSEHRNAVLNSNSFFVFLKLSSSVHNLQQQVFKIL